MMKFKTTILIFIILLLPFVYGSKIYQSTYLVSGPYCMQNSNCSITDLIVDNLLLTGNISFIGSIKNVTIVNQEVTGQLEVTGNISADTFKGEWNGSFDYLRRDGTNSPTATINWGNQYLINVATLGIGTLTPLATLDINGTLLLPNNMGVYFKLASGSGTKSLTMDTGDNLVFGSTAIDDIKFNVGGLADAVRIKETTGNVGIGTTTPVSKAHIYEDTTKVDSTAGLTVEQKGTGDALLQFLLTGVKRWVIGIDNSDDEFKIANGQDLSSSYTRLTLDNTGDLAVGSVGTQSVDNKITAVSGVVDTPVIADNENTIGIYGNGAAYFKGRDVIGDVEFIMGTSVLGGAFVGSTSNHNLWLRTNNTDRMTIDTSGNVGIGTTSPDNKLHISATGTDAYDIVFAPEQTTVDETHAFAMRCDASFAYIDTRKGIKYNYNTADLTATRNFEIYEGKDSPVNVFTITGGDTVGNVGIGTTLPTTKLDVTGIINATGYIVNGTAGYTGTCVNVTYLNGLAVSCND